MDNIVGRLKKLIPYNQFQLILGSLMGDARLECRSKEIRAKYTARLRIHQSDKQKDYVFWKYKNLKNLVLKGPRFTKVWHDPKRNKDHYSWYFHTQSNETLGYIHQLFYKNGVKILPKELLNLLEPLGLAIWYMDDGSNNGGDITLNTHCFSREEQKCLQALLLKKFGIVATIVKDRSKLKLAIGCNQYQKFIDIVKPFVIESMNYKVFSPRNDLSQMRQTAII
jgi:hypothetical protein